MICTIRVIRFTPTASFTIHESLLIIKAVEYVLPSDSYLIALDCKDNNTSVPTMIEMISEVMCNDIST